jgi:elongation factor P
MYAVSDLKRGLVIELDAEPYVVESVQVSSPTARGGNTIHRVRLRSLKTRQTSDRSFRGNETFRVPDVDRRPVQMLYADADAVHFMDGQTFEQFPLRREELEWESRFLTDGLEGLRALFHNGAPVGLELPNTVVLTVTEAAPAVKGNSATGRTKPATLETGHTVQVPEHIEPGTRVVVDTRTGAFVSRAK